jgi:multidrug efflux pump subunit AcrB
MALLGIVAKNAILVVDEAIRSAPPYLSIA